MTAGGPDPVRQAFGGLLVGVGALIATVSGTCTGLLYLVLAIDLATGAGTWRSTWSALQPSLYVGILPLLTGLLIFSIGRRLRKATRREGHHDGAS